METIICTHKRTGELCRACRHKQQRQANAIRNYAIFIALQSGKTAEVVGAQYGISRARAHAIAKSLGKEVQSMPPKKRFAATLPGTEVTPDTRDAVLAIAEENQTSVAQVIRDAVIEYVKRHSSPVEGADEPTIQTTTQP